jgi:hypothetical protein
MPTPIQLLGSYTPWMATSDLQGCLRQRDSPLPAAGIPDQVGFATKLALATRMITHALDAGVPASWVAGDEVHGADPGLRAELEARGVGCVLAVACDHRVVAGGDTWRADALATRADRDDLQRGPTPVRGRRAHQEPQAPVARVALATPTSSPRPHLSLPPASQRTMKIPIYGWSTRRSTPPPRSPSQGRSGSSRMTSRMAACRSGPASPGWSPSSRRSMPARGRHEGPAPARRPGPTSGWTPRRPASTTASASSS